MIRKISIPRWIIVFSSSLLALINLGLNLIVVIVMMLVNQVEITWHILLLPIVLLELYVFALGISLFLSAAFVKYRDVNYIWEVVLQAGFYLTPILYSLTIIPVQFQKIMLISPLAQVIQDARLFVVSQNEKVVTAWRVFDGGWYALIPIVITILTLILGIIYFRSQSKSFAENI